MGSQNPNPDLPNKSQNLELDDDSNLNYSRIHGIWYNLSAFRNHPGGQATLHLAKGRDATVLFESHHPFTSRSLLASMLEKYKVNDLLLPLFTLEELNAKKFHINLDPDQFHWPSNPEEDESASSIFVKDVKASVKSFFVAEARKRGISVSQIIKATPGRKLFNIGLFISLLGAGQYMMKGNYAGIPLVSLLAWLNIAHTFHDLSHYSITSNADTDSLLSYFFPFFTSPTTWSHQHIVGHHAYPNIPGRDPDIFHTPELRRDHPQHDHLPAHLTQHTMPVLVFNWSFAIILGLNVMDEISMLWHDSYNKCVPLYPMSIVRKCTHASARLSMIYLVLSWPFHLLPASLFLSKLVFSLAPVILFSLLFMLCTQINHLSHSCIDAPPSKSWYIHQLSTSQSIAPSCWSRFHFLLSGGLCLQIEHHLFPTINHGHLPAVQRIVMDCSQRHGVKYTKISGFSEGVWEYWLHSRSMALGKQGEHIDEIIISSTTVAKAARVRLHDSIDD